jgi:hypothetical protein
VSSASWQPVLERMFDELDSREPRAESYWVQQLAFAPVVFHAIVGAVRKNELDERQLELLRGVLPLVLSALGALPDGCEGDPTTLQLLARRQASALAWGRRRQVVRLATRLELDLESEPFGVVPRRFQRPYPLIGWRP